MFYVLTKATEFIPDEINSMRYLKFKNTFQCFENKIYDYEGGLSN